MKCALCSCPAVTRVHGLQVCPYHEAHGEDDPACPACAPAVSVRAAEEVAGDQVDDVQARRPHFSHSALDMLSKCGLQYRFRYVEGLKSPPGVALLRGSGTHGAVQADLEAKIATGELLDDEEVASIAADVFDERLEVDGVALTDDEVAEGSSKVIGRAKDAAVRLARHHHRHDAPGLRPVHVERFLRVELEGFPRDLVGFVDLQEPACVEDLKTASKSPSADAADTSIQLTAYHLMLHAVDGKAPPVVRIRSLVNNKVPKSVVLESTRDVEDWKRFLRRLELANELVDAGAFYPARPDDWWCSSRFCGYWSRCPFGARGRRATVPVLSRPKKESK